MSVRPSPSAVFGKVNKALSKLQSCASFSSTAAFKTPIDAGDEGIDGGNRGMSRRRPSGPKGRNFNPSTIDRLSSMYKDLGASAQTFEDRNRDEKTKSFMAQMPRRWRKGDVYAPRDLSPYEQNKWRGGIRHKKDVLDILGINPLDNYRNFSMISEFMTPFGRIKHSDETGLRPVNQRKMAKAIRRAIGLGIHPSVHYHPEILARSDNHIARQTKSEGGPKVRDSKYKF